MSNNIEDKKGNYEVVRNILSSRYQEVNGYDFYRYIFPDNQNVGELSGNYSKPNAIYLYRGISIIYVLLPQLLFSINKIGVLNDFNLLFFNSPKT